MDHDQPASPDHSPPDHDKRASDHSNTVINSADMATMVATANVNNMPGPIGGPSLNKRYRPAPAKTFQCRGYGECRMVFSRSEHLARHIRKHTGERPFSCHCGKQFSRLDNLRQHAQTVHADKQEQNERMMRDLTSLHATMAAANKGGPSRVGARRAPALPTLSLGPGGGQGEPSPNEPLNLIKQEDGGMSGMPLHQRPGTATGYEGEMMYGHSPSWTVQANEMEMQQQQHRAHHHHSQDARRPSGQHSFRGDPSQSFLASQSSSSQSSFRGQYAHFDGNGNGPRPSSSSRPPTSSGQSLPPLAAVVSASLPSPPLPSGPGYSSSSTNSQSGLQAFPFPGTLALRRPGTSSSRPGTAPSGGAGGASASFFNDGPPGSSSGKFGAYGGIGMGSSLLHSGFSSGRGTSSSGIFSYMAGYDSNSASSSGPGAGCHSGGSPTGGSNEPSPFYFQPPALDQQQQQQQAGSSPTSSNPRKRAFGAPDGPFEHNAPTGRESAAGSLSANNNSVGLGVGSGFSGLSPLSAFGGSGEAGNAGYEYGTESRPQSRRLSVMELCNDDAQRQQQVHQATLATALVAAANERERYASNGSSIGVSSAAAYGNANANGHAATNGNGAGAGHAHGAAGVGHGGADGGAAGAAAHGAFLLSAAGAANAGAGSGGYGGGYGLSGAAASSSATGERPTTSSGLVSSASALHIFDGDSDSEDRAHSGHQYGNGHGNGSGSGSASPPRAIYGGTSDATAGSARGSIGDAVASGSVYSSAGAGGQYAGGHSPAPASVGGSHSPPGVGYTAGGTSGFYAASPALSVQHHHQHHQHHGQPTPTPSPHPGLLPAAPYALNASPAPSVYGTRPAGPGAGQQQQYQFGGSPTFSGASSVASYASPRSPLSDGSAGSASPFSSYAQPQHRAESVHHHPHHQQQQQQQHHQQQQYAGHQQQQQYEQHAQQQYHHAGQYASQRVSPIQYDGAGYVYDADGVPHAHGQFQSQQQQQQQQRHSQHYTHDGRYEQHAHEQRYAGGHRHGGHEQRQHDIRISVSPHATPTFGMRV